jgi:hypothetical protein
MRALILSGLASMPFIETKQSMTFLFVIPNMHFSGLSFRLALHIFAKVSAKSEMYVSFFLLVVDVSYAAP